jgi:syntaxin 16
MPEETEATPTYEDSDQEYSQITNVRSDSITLLLRNISELGIIFRDLNVLVVEQGTILDRIDYNIECAVEHTGKAVDKLI